MQKSTTIDLSIGQRLALGFGTVLMLLLLLIGFSLYESYHVEKLERRLTRLIGPRADAANAIEDAYFRQAIAARNYALSPEPQHLQEYRDAVEEGTTALDRLQLLPKDADGFALFISIPPLADEYEQAASRFLALAQQGTDRDRLRSVERELGETRSRLLRLTQDYVDLQVRKRQAAHAEILALQTVSGRVFLLMSVLILGVGVATAISTTHAVRRPTLRLVKITRSLEAGDYREALALHDQSRAAKAAARPRNELTELTAAVGRMAAALQVREERLEADAEVASALAGSIEPQPLAEEVLARIATRAGCEFGAVYALEPSGSRLHRVASYALDGAAPEIAVGEGIPGQAVARRESVVIREIPGDTPFRIRFGFEDVPPRTVIAAPLLFQDQARGVLLLGSVRSLPEEAIQFVEHSARGLAVSLQNALAHREVMRLASELQEKNEELEAQNEEIQAQNDELQAQSEEIQAQNEELQSLNEEIYAQNDELKRITDELSEVDRQKEQFLAMLGHELRNPLAAMRNAASVLRKSGPEAARWQRALGVFERQLQHQRRLVDELLDISRINRGKIELRRETVDLARLVRETAEDCRPPAEEARLRFSVDAPEGPVWVDGDPIRLAQVLVNFLNNAVKYNREGGEVTVRMELEGRKVRVSVRDTGLGIAPETLPRVWNAFEQEERSLDRSQGGLGLGLALVKGLVELHQGEVYARSEGLGRGSEFGFLIPLADSPPPDAGSGAGTPRETAVGGEPKASPTLRVLVVEDNRDAAETLRDLLELLDHEVRIAQTGVEAVEAAREMRPDLVLCDLGLPGIDGYEVARRLRADPATAGIRLAALTGYGGDEDRRRTREAGFDLHLVKPVEPAELDRLLASG